MKHRLLYLFIGLLCWSGTMAPTAAPWGFWAHKRINRIAVFTLPPEMIGFYKANIDYITEHAVDPDKRRYSMEGEAPRHYIDLDVYGEMPFDNVPRYWDSALAKFGEDSLNLNGIVPWHCNFMLYRLTKAFESKDKRRILQLSAELGHYLGDAHVPLHTTKNYNGQLTDQYGIHGFWESRIPELLGENFDYFVGTAGYITKPQEAIWEIVLSSHAAVDSVLLFEKELSKEFTTEEQYSFEQRGAQIIKTYSAAYTAAYDDKMNGMVERRLRTAIINLGSFWYTAWVNAGQPNLDDLLDIPLTEEERKAQEELEKQYRENKIKGREHDH